MTMTNVLPLIKEKWPNENKQIYLQHDNASTHFGSDYALFIAAARAEGWDIQLTKQSANSADLISIIYPFSGHCSQLNETPWRNQTIMFDV